jgi:hypothetical protein
VFVWFGLVLKNKVGAISLDPTRNKAISGLGVTVAIRVRVRIRLRG